MAWVVTLLKTGRVQIWLSVFIPGLLVTALVVAIWCGGLTEPPLPWWMAAILIVMVAFLTAWFSYLLLTHLVGSLKHLRVMASELSQGNYLNRLPELPAYFPTEMQDFAWSMNRLADALQGHERMRRDLISNVAHELRTPLTNLRGYLEGMRDGVIPTDQPAIASLHEETMRLTRLVDGLHQISHAEALTLRRLDLRPIALDALVHDLVRSMSATVQSRGIQVSVRLHAAELAVPVHPQAIEQVMRNLLQNAHQYTETGGWIRVESEVEAGNYRFRCSNGPTTLTAEDVPYLFQRFFRGKNAVQEYGAGLGLPVARELVQAHGGVLTASILGDQFIVEMTMRNRPHTA